MTAALPLQPADLSADGWAPFGWLPRPDTDERDGQSRLEFAWSDVHVNIIGHTAAEIPHTPEGLLCQMMFRHDTHTQVLMSLDVEAVVAVAPASVDFSQPSDAGTIRAFRLRPLESIVLHRGTWHWGPFPVHADSVRLFNVQGLRYAEDNTGVDLAGRDMPVEILLPAPSGPR